jgi:hypothetical protein
MPQTPLNPADRLERQYRRLGTRNPACLNCGESNPFCLELHHVAGKKHYDDTGIVCRNCHRKLTDQQNDHIQQSNAVREHPFAHIGHYLLGLADFLIMIVNALREFGKTLIGAPNVEAR